MHDHDNENDSELHDNYELNNFQSEILIISPKIS